MSKDTAKLSAPLLTAPQLSDTSATTVTALTPKTNPKPPPAEANPQLLPLQVELKSPYNEMVPTDLSYVDQGVYRVKYLPPFAGAFELNVKLCGEHVRGSPFTVHVQKRVKAFLTNEQLLRHSLAGTGAAPHSGTSRSTLGFLPLGNAGTGGGGAASVRSGHRSTGNAMALSASTLFPPTGANRKADAFARGGPSGTRGRQIGLSRAESSSASRDRGRDVRDARSKSRQSASTSVDRRSHSQTRAIGLGNGSVALTLPKNEYAASSIARRSPTNPNLKLSAAARSAAGGERDGDDRMRIAMSSSMTSSRLLSVTTGGYAQSLHNGVLRIGSRGRGPGEFLSPQGIAVCVGTGSGGSNRANSSGPGHAPTGGGGRILVTDAQNANVQVFASGTQYVGQFGTRGKLSGQLQRPAGVCELPDGRIVVVDQENKWLNVYDEHCRCVLPSPHE